ncbi:MAG: amidohydrolase family protein [Rhizobiales bacterium]|nr:amidohydrolase family protein [Hyphomicrobiales bacterium]
MHAQDQGSKQQTTTRFRIDTHHHLFPPKWLAEHTDDIIAVAPGIPPTAALEWTPQKSIDGMDRVGIETAILSIATPGTWFGNVTEARGLTRHCNEYGARLIADYPRRFGMFASLALPDVEGSLREIEHAYDVLKLDGAGLMTSYDGKWPGDPSFVPVFDELNRRKAVVYFHPTCPPFARNLIPEVPPAITEFVFDTTRAINSLLYSGTLSRCPNIRFIFSHGGGTVPFLADRIASLARRPNAADLRARIPQGVEYELRKLYYDVVSVTGNLHGMRALIGLADPSHLLFGTDFPYYRVNQVDDGSAMSQIPELEARAINRDNALALFPRLAKR